MNAMLFCAISAGLMVTALPIQPARSEQPDLVVLADNPAPPAQSQSVDVERASARPGAIRDTVRVSSADRAAVDDAEFERLMEAAPDVGTFGESVIVDPETGVETRVSGFGFSDQ